MQGTLESRAGLLVRAVAVLVAVCPTLACGPAESMGSGDDTTSTVGAVSENLIRNPGCETDTSYWGTWQGTLSRTTSYAHSGVASCEVIHSSGTVFTIDDTPNTVANPAQGSSYTATAWVRGPSAKPARLYLRQQGGATAPVIESSNAVTLTSGWQQLSLTVTIAAAGRTSLDIYVGLSNAAAGDRFAVDDISLVRNDTTPSDDGTSDTSECTRYVSTTGSDSNSGTTSSTPVKTLARANTLAQPGDVWCFANGVYTAANVTLSTSGTSTAPITYRSTSGKGAILDAAGQSISSTGSMVNVTGSHVTLSNFEARNSSGRGLTVTGATGVTLRGNKVHDIQYAAILVTGHTLKVDGNEVYNAAASNQNGHFGGASCSNGGWPAVLQTWYIWPNTSDRSTNVSFTNNYVHHSWGEGLGLFHVNGGVVKGNTVKDTWSVLLYLDGSANITIDSNYLSATNSTYYRCDSGSPANAILMSGEQSYDLQLANNVIKNNVVAGAGRAISYWNAGAGIGYSNLKILNNTLWGTKSPAIKLDTSPGTPSGTLKNNIIFGSGSIALGNGSFSITNNAFPNGVPSGASTSANFAFDPQLVAPAAGAPATSFRVSSTSPAKGAGTSLGDVTVDYFGTSRSSTPTIGFHEYK